MQSRNLFKNRKTPNRQRFTILCVSRTDQWNQILTLKHVKFLQLYRYCWNVSTIKVQNNRQTTTTALIYNKQKLHIYTRTNSQNFRDIVALNRTLISTAYNNNFKFIQPTIGVRFIARNNNFPNAPERLQMVLASLLPHVKKKKKIKNPKKIFLYIMGLDLCVWMEAIWRIHKTIRSWIIHHGWWLRPRAAAGHYRHHHHITRSARRRRHHHRPSIIYKARH